MALESPHCCVFTGKQLHSRFSKLFIWNFPFLFFEIWGFEKLSKQCCAMLQCRPNSRQQQFVTLSLFIYNEEPNPNLKQGNMSQTTHVTVPTPTTCKTTMPRLFIRCLLTLVIISVFGGASRGWVPSLLNHLFPQLTLSITNDIMAICHAPRFSDVLPTHLLWYLVTDPAAESEACHGAWGRPPSVVTQWPGRQ